MSKYYTPTIEEFHIGFEYEANVYNTKKGSFWLKTKMDLTFDFYTGNTRVKYLDREDIESLGFNISGLEEKLYLSNSKIKLYPHLEPCTVAINFYPGGNNHCLIFYVPNENNIPAGVNLFVGQIKNKSELKTLLKQLNIK